MRVIQIESLEVHLIGNQAYVYSDSESDVLNIDNIEFMENPEESILDEIRFKNKKSLMEQLSLL
ncbi:MAG: hypothetical protein JXQ67_05905 [Campylobacterales bacterium]|nr:hypothetical protein [Campylobacterales bacterium]